MKIGVYILLLLSISVSSCKRKRKVNVEGMVTDAYTRLPVPNMSVKLYSQISPGTTGGTKNEYTQITDVNGYFYFKSAVFSKPENFGWLVVNDENYQDVEWLGGTHSINKEQIKFIGKTTLTKNIQVICTAKLKLTLNTSTTLDVSYAKFYRKFVTSKYIPQNYREFLLFGTWHKVPTQNDYLPQVLVGYNDGKNVFRTEYFDETTQTLKTAYDTIISQGCGSVNSYTINLN